VPSRHNQWFNKKIIGATKDEMRPRVMMATIFVRDQIKRSINISNHDGSSPSLEGEPPHKVTGDLQRSIASEVVDEGEEIVGRVGTNSPYAPRLEYGFRGTDSKGRSIQQGPRPFIRPGFNNNLAIIKRILTSGK